MFICPTCGNETRASQGMACHCLLKHYAASQTTDTEVRTITEIIVSMVDTLSAESPSELEAKMPVGEILKCSGHCDDCFSRLLSGLREAGYLDGPTTKLHKWLYAEYPAIAIPGVHCLRYDNGFWYLRSEEPQWLRNPFRDEDGYWYEAAL